MAARIRAGGVEYTGRTVESIVRREWGRKARIEHSRDGGPDYGYVVTDEHEPGSGPRARVHARVSWVEGDHDAPTTKVIARRWPEADQSDVREWAQAGALHVIDSEDDARLALAAAVETWQTASAAEREAHAKMTGAIIAAQAVTSATEVQLMEWTGLARRTIRRALGRNAP